MNIVLIGMRGTGKTTVGKLLADQLGYRFVDTDEMIMARSGKSIDEIVTREGWERFRERETEAVAEVAGRDMHVIACGGGVVVRDENIQALRQNGIIVWLHAPVGVLAERIRRDEGALRPALTKEANLESELTQLAREREAVYSGAAHIAIAAQGKTPLEIVDEIIPQLNKYED